MLRHVPCTLLTLAAVSCSNEATVSLGDVSAEAGGGLGARRIPYWGYYMTYAPSNPYISAAQGNADFLVLNIANVTPDLVQHLGPTNVLYEISLDRSRFAETEVGGYNDQQIASQAAAVRNVPGLMEKVLAVGLIEEWYTMLRGGGLDDVPFFRQRGLHVANRDAAGNVVGFNLDHYRQMANLLRDQLAVLVDHAHRHFGKPALWTDTVWSSDPAAAQYYAPPPANLDYVALDAYMPYAMSDACDDANRARFDRDVRQLFLHAATLGKPIIAVGQAFRDTGELWQHMPSPCQMDWWIQLANEVPQIGAIAWFHPISLHGLTGFASDPARLQHLNQRYRENVALR